MPYFDVKEILSTAIKIVDEHGYVSSKSSNRPTWKLVDKYIQEHVKHPIEDDSINHIKIDVVDESLKITEWVKAVQDKSSYMLTAKDVVHRGYCGKHLFGLVTSLIPIYRKHRRG